MRFSTANKTKQPLTKRLVLGFVGLATAATVGTVGMASANAVNKPTKQQCAAAGYTNYGQCVKDWAHNKPKPGSGYGGGNNNTVNTDVNLEVNGDGNTIDLFFSYIFG